MEKKRLLKKERHRSTHLELLGGVSGPELRALREIAGRADLPVERVFRDVVAIGLSVISDPAESPYQSLIAFRSGLAAKQKELEDARTGKLEALETSGDTGSGSGGTTLLDPGQDEPAVFSEESLTDRFDYVTERPGLGAEIETDSGQLAQE